MTISIVPLIYVTVFTLWSCPANTYEIINSVKRLEQPPNLHQWRADAMVALDEQIAEFYGIDPIVSQILEGYRTELAESERSREALDAISELAYTAQTGKLGEPPPVSGFWYVVRAATVKQLLQEGRPGYDLATFARYPALWRPYVHDLLIDPSRWGELAVDVMGRRLSTNRVSRRNSLLGFMALARDRFGDQVSVLDLGCSLNLILKAMALRYPSGDLQVMHNGTLRPSWRRTAQLTQDILPHAPELEYGYGVDLIDFVHEYNALPWVKSCPYPREILEETLDPAGPSEFSRLLDAEVPEDRVTLYTADMTSEERMADLQEATGGRRFDVASFIFSAYQTGKAWPEALRIAKQHVRPDGFIFVMGHVKRDPDDKTNLQFSSHWHRHAVRSYVLDLAATRAGWQEIFRSDGRFKRIWLGAGKIALDPEGRPKSVPKLFDRASERQSSGARRPYRRRSA